jgi:hypothetical protein
MFHHCSKCNRKFPWGISAQDGVCFVCRHPSFWRESDEEVYQANLKRAVPVKVAKEAAKEETS